MVNIVDVARLADVSTMTVSRVLNEDPRVRPRTRRLVLQAIEELGYVPNEAARGLRNARTRAIGVVVADLINPAFIEAIQFLEGAIAGRGYSMLLCDSRNNPEVEATNVRRLYERRVEGLVVYSVAEPAPSCALFARAGIPHVIVQLLPSPSGSGNPTMRIGDGMHAGLAHLVELGHRRLALVAPDYPPYNARVADFEAALAALGLPFDPRLVQVCHTTEESLAATMQLLRLSERPTALFCGYHVYAPFVLAGVRALGLAMPRDISFVTMGDSPWARHFWPSLTVATGRYVGMGQTIADYLFARIAGEPAEQHLEAVKATMAYDLIVRESTAPPPA
ncbi:MAG: LacI family DNA-binding transcriptional regulator [Chloroflexota bacterium]